MKLRLLVDICTAQTRDMNNAIPHYEKIAKVIAYLDTQFKGQPSLDTIADQVYMSPFHLQRLFKEWVGVSPKKYIQFLSVNYTKSLLQQKGATLFDAAADVGLSGTGRLHDLFVNIEGITPGEYKNGGANLCIAYSFAASPFGKTIIASTQRGICYLAFIEDEQQAIHELKSNFPNAIYREESNTMHAEALHIFREGASLSSIRLHLKGSPFQLKVWQALLEIPEGKLSTYGAIAKQIENPKASRAVGTAIGNNPVAYLIPCHRVIQASGVSGGYRWNPIRKKAILAYEAAKQSIAT